MAEPTSGIVPGTFQDTLPRQDIRYLSSNLRTDAIEYLPPGAADRLRALRDHVAERHALCVPWEDRREATTARLHAEARLGQLRGHPQDGGMNLPPSNRSVIDAEKQLAKLSDEERRLNKRYEARSAAWAAAGQVLAAVESWIADGRPGNTVLEDFAAPEPKLQKGEDILAGLDRLRRRGRELKADLHRIRSAPFPSSHAKQQMRSQVEALATRGAVCVSGLVEHDGKIEIPTLRVTSRVIGPTEGGLAFAEAPDAIGLIVWLHRDALVAKLDREIDREADDQSALTHEARQQQEAQVLSDLLDVERLETEFVFRAQREGFSGIEHRNDVSPLALLSLKLITSPHPTALPPTSPSMAVNFVGPGR